ncbi:MAG: DUF2846 domain-containing protein [Proteobacteria bacterium]|nr:DUF2846 domain-containing protein [Pseudomonadota bacterium]
MESQEASTKAKQFAAPAAGSSGLYVYRDSTLGGALKKDIHVDGKCLGESGPNTFFYTEVAGGKEHVVETESEFSPNKLTVMFDAGKNYFIRQYIKLGLIAGGADLEQVTEAQGKQAVSKLDLATPGTCGN